MNILASKRLRSWKRIIILFGACALVTFLAPACSGGDGGEATDKGAPTTDQGTTDTGPAPACTAGMEEISSSLACDLCDSTKCVCTGCTNDACDGWIASGDDCGTCDLSIIELCELDCENGYKQDSNGCDICACSDGPTTCTEGETQAAPDGCNTCTCTEGAWVCTEEACTGCTPGEVKDPPEDCCTCSEAGAWECTEIPCPAPCSEGDTKEKGDGCNTCTCNGNSEWVCTTEICGEGQDCPPALEHDCESKTFWGKNYVTGTCCEYASPCAIPEEVEKYAALEDCEAGPWAGSDPNPTEAFDEGIPADSAQTPEGDPGSGGGAGAE